MLSIVRLQIFPIKSQLKEGTEEIKGKISSYRWINENKMEFELKLKKERIIVFYKMGEEQKKDWQNISFTGATIKINGSVNAPQQNSIPNTFSYQKYLKSKKIFWIIQGNNLEIIKEGTGLNKIKDKIRNLCNTSQNRVYLKKILLGIQEQEEKIVQKIYRQNGISHIFAISGMHFGFLYQMIYRFTKKISKKEKFSLLLALIGITLYASLLTPSISSQRAYSFLCILTYKKIFHWNLDIKCLFYYNLSLFLIINPYAMYGMSFQYSFLLSFVFLNFATKEKKKWKQIWINSAIAFLASIPITASNMYSINPWAIVNNILWIPIISGILFPLLILSFFVKQINPFASTIIKVIEQINFWTNHFPLADITMPKISTFWFGIYYFLLFALLKYKKKQVFCILILFFLAWKSSSKWNPYGYIHFLDVGQGDSALIIAPYHKEIILIDTGPPNEYIAENILLFLKSLGITKLDALILSHGDKDHSGNVISLLEKIEINKVIRNQGDQTEVEELLQKKYPKQMSKSYISKNLHLVFLSHKERKNENQNSNIIHLCILKTCTLFMGDATKEIEEEIIQKYSLKTTILKVGHHGSKTSTEELFLKKIQPKIAIISAGKKNIYHHPHQEVINRLKKQGITIYNTQEGGTISLKIKKKGYNIQTTIT